MSCLPHPIDVQLESAIALLKRGDFGRSEALLSEITRAAPANGDAWLLLGAIALQTNRTLRGASLLENAVKLSPDNPIYLTNLGEAYRRLGQLERAIASLERAASQQPTLAAAHYNLGLSLAASGRTREALAALQQAVQLMPNVDLDAHLANVLSDDAQYERAVQHARRMLGLRRSAAAHSALGNALIGTKNYEEAIEQHSFAIALEPNRAASHIGKGQALCYLGRADEGIRCLQVGAQLNPASESPHVLMAESHLWGGRIAEAIVSCRRALELSSDPKIHSRLIFALVHDPDSDDVAILAEAQAWSRSFEQPLSAKRCKPVRDRRPDRRLRVGYLSSGFRDKPDCCFTVPLLAHHDHERFEIYCYSYTWFADAYTEKNRAHADVWRDVQRRTDDEVAEQIQSDEIDILIDLGLHSPDGQLTVFARKPAPVQICWLAYPGTTGLQSMDYRITDPYLSPPGSERSGHSERNLWLPDSFWCYDPLRSEPDVNELPALRNGYVTFASFNRFGKINGQVLELWARALQAVDGSRLMIYAPPGVNPAQFYRPFDEIGVARDRIRTTLAVSKQEFLLMHHKVDIALDPFPCNGGTTSLDALWMGVPVVTLVGKTSVGRIGLSLLSNLALDNLVAYSPERYIEIAVELSSDLGNLAALRRGLRSRLEQSPLMNAPRFARNMESLYQKAWHDWCCQGE